MSVVIYSKILLFNMTTETCIYSFSPRESDFKYGMDSIFTKYVEAFKNNNLREIKKCHKEIEIIIKTSTGEDVQNLLYKLLISNHVDLLEIFFQRNDFKTPRDDLCPSPRILLTDEHVNLCIDKFEEGTDLPLSIQKWYLLLKNMNKWSGVNDVTLNKVVNLVPKIAHFSQKQTIILLKNLEHKYDNINMLKVQLARMIRSPCSSTNYNMRMLKIYMRYLKSIWSKKIYNSTATPHIPLLSSDVDSKTDVTYPTCVICNEMEVKIICLPCGHYYSCRSCLEKGFNTMGKKCSICRCNIQVLLSPSFYGEFME